MGSVEDGLMTSIVGFYPTFYLSTYVYASSCDILLQSTLVGRSYASCAYLLLLALLSNRAIRHTALVRDTFLLKSIANKLLTLCWTA